MFAFIFFLPRILGWYQDGVVGTGAASAFLAIAGAIGLTKASMLATVRSRLRQWSELLWDRAVMERVSDNTLVLNEVLPEPVADSHGCCLREPGSEGEARLTLERHPLAARQASQLLALLRLSGPPSTPFDLLADLPVGELTRRGRLLAFLFRRPQPVDPPAKPPGTFASGLFVSQGLYFFARFTDWTCFRQASALDDEDSSVSLPTATARLSVALLFFRP